MAININHLSYDLLKYILNFLPDKQLFVMERVCIKWQKCVLKLLEKNKSLKRLYHYSDKFKYSNGRSIIDVDNIYILKNIMSKCPNIKQLDLTNTIVTVNNLIELAYLCPKLESINFRGSKIDVPEFEMNEFAEIIGPQLVKFKLTLIYGYTCIDSFMMIMIKYMKNIEDISLSTKTIKQYNQIFNKLNTDCDNLKVLEWKSYDNNLNYQNQNMINVIKRIKHLKISLSILLRFNFEMDNLTELTLSCLELDDTINMTNQLLFANVTKLTVKHFIDNDYYFMSKFKFPKLETLSIIKKNNFNIPTDQFKHIKSLYLESYSIIPKLILQLNQLTDFVWKCICTYYAQSSSLILLSLDVLSQHHSLKNIKLEFDDFYMNINMQFYEKIINFCKAKPNTKIVIKIPKQHKTHYFYHQMINNNHYKDLFDVVKHAHKLNMELVLIN